MKKTINALAIALTGLCAFAGIDCLYLDASETQSIVARPAKVLYVADGGSTVKFERTFTGTASRITDLALTNLTYSVVTTNSAGSSVTNVLSRPHPIPYPDTMTGYWTNTVVTTRSTTNFYPVVTSVSTNALEASTFLCPGDLIFAEGLTGRAIIWLEK